MRRSVVVVSVVLGVVAVGIVVAAVSRSGGSGSDAVASVGSRRVTRAQLELMVEHFHEEADAEGRPFPDEGTQAFRAVERRALALLIYRRRLELAAGRIGVHVSRAEVERRLSLSTGGEAEGTTLHAKAEAAFARGTVRAQLLTQRVFDRVTAGVAVPPAVTRAYYRSHRPLYGRTPFRELAASIRRQLLAARRNLAMSHWVAKAERIPAKIGDDELKG
jgi:hypothetical protein